MDTSSDSDGALSLGAYNDQAAYNAAAAVMTGYDDLPAIIKSPSRHSESSGSGSDVAEPRSSLAHHKFSIDRILGRFSGGDAAAATTIDSCPETSDTANRHRNDLTLRGVGECNRCGDVQRRCLSQRRGDYIILASHRVQAELLTS